MRIQGIGRRPVWRAFVIGCGSLAVLVSLPLGTLRGAPREPVRAVRPQSGKPKPLPLTKEEKQLLDATVDKAPCVLGEPSE